MKTVLVDFSHLGDLCGFGEIARNYAPLLAATKFPEDIHFIFIVPHDYIGVFGNEIDYIDKSKKRRQLKLLKRHIDLWHATDQQFGYRHRSKGTLQLLTIHDLNFLHEKKGVHKWRHIIQLRWRIRHSDYLIAISNYVKEDVMTFGTAGKPIDVIYNGIRDGLEKCARRRPEFVKEEEKGRFFFTIGQIREKKNFASLVPMMKHFPGYKLFICGDDHFSYSKELRGIIDEYGEGRVFLTGKITDEEKNWLYDNCCAFLFPSKLEGFGIPVLEAMRFRCKVFSSRLSSLPEVCGRHATYWDNFEPEHMAKVVSDGISVWNKNSSEAAEAANYSMQFCYKKYTERYMDLYRKLLAECK